MRVAFHLWVVMMAMAISSAALRAGEAIPLLQPQWIASATNEQLIGDWIGASADPAAVRLTDGGEVTVTITNSEIVMRRYAADGSVERAKSTTIGNVGQIDVVIRAAAADDAFYVLAGGAQSEALLMRFDSDLEHVWTVIIPDEAICEGDGECLRLEVLNDGSVVAMRAFRVIRVAAGGLIQWSYVDSSGTTGGFWGADLAIDTTTIWVATTGASATNYLDKNATLTRLDFDGVLLSADVSSCHGCGGVELTDIDLTGDGGARVVGNSDGRGFFARYDALGYRLFWVANETPQAYFRLDHDAANACYVLAGDEWTKFVNRIDPATGAMLWSVPTIDFVARDVGVTIVGKTASAIEASAVDASGTTLWTLPLTQSDGGGYRVWSRPRFVGGDTELLVEDLAVSDDPCAHYPRFARMDVVGTLTRFTLPCRAAEVSALVWDIDASPSGGVLVNTLAQLASYSPNGDLRWRLEACLWCTDADGASAWAAATMAPDAGAWAVRWDRPTLALPDGQTKIQRFDANGILAFEIASVASAAGIGSGFTDVQLLSGLDDVVMLRSGFARGLSWQRVGSDGADLGSHIYSIPDQSYHITEARRLPDGSTVVLAKGWGYCNVGCPPFYVTVLRIANDGTLIWRYQFPETYAPGISIALGNDGGAVAVFGYGVLSMRVIGNDGSAGSDIPLVAIDPFVQPGLLTAALQGRWLLNTESNTGEVVYWLLDGDGHVAITRRNGPYSAFLHTSTLGYLATEAGAETENVLLLDTQTLADSARFNNGAGYVYGPRPWRILDDGTVYGTITLPQSGYQAIARYSAPGGIPSDVIFRSGMD